MSNKPAKENKLVLYALLLALVAPPTVASFYFDWSKAQRIVPTLIWVAFVFGALILRKKLLKRWKSPDA